MKRTRDLLRRPINAFLLFVICLSVLMLPNASAAFKYLQEGMTVPEIKGKDLLTSRSVSSKYTGDGEEEVLFIAFWATWSQRSLDLLEDLNSMALEFADYPLRIIAVNIEGEQYSSEDKNRIRSLVTRMDLRFPVLLDEKLKYFNEYGVVAVPSTAVVGADRVLLYGPAGYSYTIRDQLVDSTQVLLGLKERGVDSVLVAGYIPARRSSRYYNLALQMNNRGMSERALEHIKTAIAADTLFSAPNNLLGQIRLALGDVQEALPAFEKAVALDSSSVSAWSGWGAALLAVGETEGSREKLEWALGLDESYAPAMIDLAGCHARSGEWEKALELLDHARELNPRDRDILGKLGLIRRERGDLAGAVEALRAALDLKYPDY